MFSKKKSLRINLLTNTIKTISSLLFPLITFPYISRVLGPENTGHINFAFSFVGYFVFLGTLGIPLYGIREVAKLRDDKRKLIKLTKELFIIHLFASLLSSLILIIFILINGKISHEQELFFIVSSTVILSSIGLEWLYQGLEEYVYITTRSLIFSTLSVISIFVFIHDQNDYILSASITVCATVGSNFLNFFNARHLIFGKCSEKLGFKHHFRPLFNVYLMNFMVSIYVNIDTVLLGFMSTMKSVGLYSTSMKLTKMLLGIVTSIGSVMLPRLSYYVEKKMTQEFDVLLQKSLSIILLFSLPLMFGMILLSKQLIFVMAGPLYLSAYHCMIITAPIIVFIALTNIFGIQILYPLGHDKKVTFSLAVGAILSLLFNIILIPKLHHIGTAIATLFSELAVLIMQLIMLKTIYKIRWPWCNTKKYFISSFVMSIVITFILLTIPNNFISLFISIVFGTFFYFLLLYLLKEEFFVEVNNKLFKSFIRKNSFK